jgi:hypothetical protein
VVEKTAPQGPRSGGRRGGEGAPPDRWQGTEFASENGNFQMAALIAYTIVPSSKITTQCYTQSISWPSKKFSAREINTTIVT